MSDLLLQTAKLVPSSKRLHPTAGSALAYCKESESKDQAGLGCLMVIIEILGPTKKAEELIDAVVHAAHDAYFAEGEDTPNDIESRFEATIRDVNNKLDTEAGLKDWPGKISAVIGVFSGNSLLLTSTGSAEAYLFRGQRHSSITTGLGDSTKSDHLFTNIANGQLQVGDQLAIVTPALLHQVSQTELKSIVGNLTPSSAVAKLAQLIEKQTNTNRTAALIATVTTPELLAMNVRSGEPSEVTVAQPVTMPNLTPALEKANTTVTGIGKHGWHGLRHKIMPAIGSLIRSSVSAIRSVNNPVAKRALLAASVIVLLVGVWAGVSITRANTLGNLEKQYLSAYDLSKSGEAKLQAQDKTGASNDLNASKKILDTLSASSSRTELEKRLQLANRPSDDPVSVKGMLDVVSAKLDQIDNISRLSSSSIHNFAEDKNNKSPQFLEVLAEKIVAVSTENGQVTVLDSGGKVLTSSEGKKDIGKVVGVTPNASEDGLFLMTEEPSLWLYKIADNSLTKQEVSLGSLVKGSAIGSYNGNVYILTENGVFKHTPTLSGFSTPSPSIKFDGNSSLKSASTLAVDGNIYVGGGASKLERFLAGASTHKSQDLPEMFAKPTKIRPVDDDTILVLSGDNGRVAVLELTEKAIVYKRQLAIKDATKMSSMTYSKGVIYAISNGKLIKAQSRL